MILRFNVSHAWQKALKFYHVDILIARIVSLESVKKNWTVKYVNKIEFSKN